MRFPRLALALLALAAPALRSAAQAPAPSPAPAPVPAAPAASTPPPTPPAASRGPSGGLGGPVAPPAPPLPYITQHALAALKFDQPLAIVTPPGETNRVFILEKTGRIIVIPDLTKPEKVTFLDLSAEIGNLDIERGLLALAFHPDYAHNRQFYLWFTVTPEGGESHDRLARFTTRADNPNQADPASEQPLINQLDSAANHNGGELMFGPDGYLYLSLGDEEAPNDVRQNSQRIDKNIFSGILRLDVDQRPGSLKPNAHPSVMPGTYTIPPDNPFVGATSFNGSPVDPAKVHTEFWAVGLRNVWRFSFDYVTGLLWEGEVGQERYEEINLIKKGKNYGWNYREGYEAFNPVPPPRGGGRGRRGGNNPPPPAPPAPPLRVPPAGVVFEDPLYVYPHPDVAKPGDTETGNCITGGFVYRGAALPALKEHYLFADYVAGWVWALTPVDGKGGKVTVEKIARRSGLVSFGLAPTTGDVLMANISTGYIEKLVPNPAFVK